LTRFLVNRLAGGKCTIADLSFIKYNDYAIRHLLPGNFNLEKEFPHLARWHNKLLARPAVQKTMRHMEEMDVGRERQHVTGTAHSTFARTSTGIARRGIAAQAAKGELISAA
jgi:glutathione S-transferase